jgi:uncharacterized protein
MDNKVFLFPLNNSLLFRKVTLPYHIFESRYRRMVKDAIDQDIPIAVIAAPETESFEGKVAVAGIPHILTTYPDGRMDIYITGSIKCQLTSLVEEGPYKVFGYRALEENLIIDQSVDLEIDSLRRMLERWSTHFLTDERQRENFSLTLQDPEVLVNYSAIFLINEMAIKKKIMEAASMEDKMKLIMKAIGPKEISLGPFLPRLKF